jgi:hypothetical protein
MERLSSRKLAGVIAAIMGVVGLLLGLAVIHPLALTEATEVVLTAIIAVAGLGGFQVYRQSIIDRFPAYQAGPNETVKRVN